MDLVSRKIKGEVCMPHLYIQRQKSFCCTDRFPENILFAAAADGNDIVAGTVIFVTKNLFHTQ